MKTRTPAPLPSRKHLSADGVSAELASSSTASTIPFSSRFAAEEKAWIDEAAKHRGISAAAFVREAAVNRAIDVLNSIGPGANDLQRLASSLAAQVDPPLDGWRRVGTPGESVRRASDWNEIDPEVWDGDWFDLRGIGCLRPADVQVLLQILETASSEFVPLLVRSIREVTEREGTYKPRILRRQSGTGGGVDSEDAVSKEKKAPQRKERKP